MNLTLQHRRLATELSSVAAHVFAAGTHGIVGHADYKKRSPARVGSQTNRRTARSSGKPVISSSAKAQVQKVEVRIKRPLVWPGLGIAGQTASRIARWRSLTGR